MKIITGIVIIAIALLIFSTVTTNLLPNINPWHIIIVYAAYQIVGSLFVTAFDKISSTFIKEENDRK